MANQIDWRQIQELLAEAQAQGDAVALSIKQLKLQMNTIGLLLGLVFYAALSCFCKTVKHNLESPFKKFSREISRASIFWTQVFISII